MAERRFPRGTVLAPDHPDHSAWQRERLRYRVRLDRSDFVFPAARTSAQIAEQDHVWECALRYPDDLEGKALAWLRRFGIRRTRDLRQRRLASAGGRVSRAQLQARVDFYGGLCWMCRTEPYEAIDHVKPISKGGSNWPANLRPACRSCNSTKRAQWPFAPALAGRGGV